MKKIRMLFKREYFRRLAFSYSVIIVMLSVLYFLMYAILTNTVADEHNKVINQILRNTRDNIDSEMLMSGQIR